MLLITKSTKNKVVLFLTAIFIILSFSFAEAKNSKDVSNTQVKKKRARKWEIDQNKTSVEAMINRYEIILLKK